MEPRRPTRLWHRGWCEKTATHPSDNDPPSSARLPSGSTLMTREDLYTRPDDSWTEPIPPLSRLSCVLNKAHDDDWCSDCFEYSEAASDGVGTQGVPQKREETVEEADFDNAEEEYEEVDEDKEEEDDQQADEGEDDDEELDLDYKAEEDDDEPDSDEGEKSDEEGDFGDNKKDGVPQLYERKGIGRHSQKMIERAATSTGLTVDQVNNYVDAFGDENNEKGSRSKQSAKWRKGSEMLEKWQLENSRYPTKDDLDSLAGKTDRTVKQVSQKLKRFRHEKGIVFSRGSAHRPEKEKKMRSVNPKTQIIRNWMESEEHKNYPFALDEDYEELMMKTGYTIKKVRDTMEKHRKNHPEAFGPGAELTYRPERHHKKKNPKTTKLRVLLTNPKSPEYSPGGYHKSGGKMISGGTTSSQSKERSSNANLGPQTTSPLATVDTTPRPPAREAVPTHKLLRKRQQSSRNRNDQGPAKVAKTVGTEGSEPCPPTSGIASPNIPVPNTSIVQRSEEAPRFPVEPTEEPFDCSTCLDLVDLYDQHTPPDRTACGQSPLPVDGQRSSSNSDSAFDSLAGIGVDIDLRFLKEHSEEISPEILDLSEGQNLWQDSLAAIGLPIGDQADPVDLTEFRLESKPGAEPDWSAYLGESGQQSPDEATDLNIESRGNAQNEQGGLDSNARAIGAPSSPQRKEKDEIDHRRKRSNKTRKEIAEPASKRRNKDALEQRTDSGFDSEARKLVEVMVGKTMSETDLKARIERVIEIYKEITHTINNEVKSRGAKLLKFPPFAVDILRSFAKDYAKSPELYEMKEELPSLSKKTGLRPDQVCEASKMSASQ